ncbi:MAG: TolC family protein [Acidobacteria bacterium]|nr:TolC family protein [Acidobacteriota bacterium]
MPFAMTLRGFPMHFHKFRRASTRVLALGFLLAAAAAHAQDSPAPAQNHAPAGNEFLRDFSLGTDWFPRSTAPYRQQGVPALQLENGPRLRDLIRDGRLELSLSDALALALENNLDIAVQRYLKPMADVDVLRTQSGQAARGVQGASVPSGLSSGALGAGVTGDTGGGGTGSAGGITGGGGAVNIGQVGSFDPAVSFGFSWDRVSSPLNSIVISGTPTSTSTATSYSGSYAQLFPTGTSYFVSLSGLRQSTTENRLFNPAVSTRFSVGINQPLLNGRGKLSNLRFVTVARNNRRITEEVFRQQVITALVAVENAYWDLAAFQEIVKVATQSLTVARKLREDNRRQAEIGTMAPLDVVAADSEVAARERDLIVAETNMQLQETRLKNMLTRRHDPALDTASIVVTAPMPAPRDADIPELQAALKSALENRPDLRQAEGNLENQTLSLGFTKQSLLPELAAFALLSGSGLEGNSPNTTPPTTGGMGGALGQAFSYDFPETAGGMSLSFSVRNRAAQADNLRAQLENSQQQVALLRSQNQVSLEVRQAIIGLLQGKAQVEAAREAARLARQTLDAEQKKLDAGVSTPYQLILRERDYVAAQQAEVQTVAGYSKALVEMDRAMGATLTRNGIELQDALSGSVSKSLTPAVAR